MNFLKLLGIIIAYIIIEVIGYDIYITTTRFEWFIMWSVIETSICGWFAYSILTDILKDRKD